MNRPKSWVMFNPEENLLGLARPELEQMEGGGWILYQFYIDKLSCRCFGGNLTIYKGLGWVKIGKF